MKFIKKVPNLCLSKRLQDTFKCFFYIEPGTYHEVCKFLSKTLPESVCIRSFSGAYFPAFGLNTERYSVSLRIQSECWKVRTRKIPNTESFHAAEGNYSSKID